MERKSTTHAPLGNTLWLALAIAILALGMYFYRFHGNLSHDSKDWADFGGYLGGTLGPAYAFMAFVIGLRTLQQARQQTRRDELLKVIQGYERDFESCASKPVTCQSPWVWGNDLSAAADVNEVALRTLLFSDGIDWEHHLPTLSGSLDFRVLPSGELVQDRDLWLQAHIALEGIFRYLDLYKVAGGDQSLVDYLIGKYEIARNRIATSSQIASNVQ